ncbi:MAG: TraR/DksA C4-type zinc finger protein [Pseudomonadota bacterium]
MYGSAREVWRWPARETEVTGAIPAARKNARAGVVTTLQRIWYGIYGYCKATGDEVGHRRLEARPVARLSFGAQARYERSEWSYSGPLGRNQDTEDLA